jgi:hypothetical protein
LLCDFSLIGNIAVARKMQNKRFALHPRYLALSDQSGVDEAPFGVIPQRVRSHNQICRAK